MFSIAGQSQIDCHFLRGYSDIDYTNLGFFRNSTGNAQIFAKIRILYQAGEWWDYHIDSS